MLKFFRVAFAKLGDKTAVPDTVELDGAVSYEQGYGFDYQRQKTDPAARNIERDKMNQVFFDVTTAISELQSQGIPDFITSALNGGTAYSYGRNAVVRYSGAIYISLADANTSTPTDATKWVPFPAFIPGGTGAVPRAAQNKLIDLPAGVADYSTVADAMAAGGLFAKDEGASGDVWYWGKYLSGAKTVGAGARNLGWGPAAYQFDIRQDSANCGSDFMRALFGRTVFGGSATQGGRIGVLGESLHNLGATNAANPNRNYVGVVGTAHSENGDGGSNTGEGARGAYFGINGIGRLAAGAANVFSVSGCELNVYAKTGASARYLFGATIAGFNEIHGSEIEAALEIGGGTDAGFGPHVGWNNGILFSNVHGSDPTNANTTLIGAYFSSGGLRSIKAGLDTSLFNCSSGIVLGPNLVLSDNRLALGASGANVSTIQAGNNVSAANLDLMPKGGGAVRLYDGINGAVRLFADNVNGIRLVPTAAGAPLNNGELVFQATSNTHLTIAFKGSDGVTRVNNLTLV